MLERPPLPGPIPCSLPPPPFAPSTPPPQYVPKRNGCGCSVVQKVDSSEAWDAFQACQEKLGNDPAVNGKMTFKALQDTRCKPGQSKGPC